MGFNGDIMGFLQNLWDLIMTFFIRWLDLRLGYGSTRTDGGPCGPLIFDVNLESFRNDFFR
jgi:hypothetical protein